MNPIERLCQRRELGGHLEQRRDRLRRIALSWSRNRSLADDLVQETFEKALRHFRQLREIQSFDAWLFHILHNCWMDHLRRERPCEDIETLSNTDEFATEQPQERMDIVQRVRAAIARLPLGQREVLSLVDLAGFSYAEVAMILEIPTGTVTSRISRARESLRDQLAPLTEQPRGNIVPISVAHA
jgi:RNA polymerase sigma-70 factor (ECF subfamily)